MNTTVTDQDGNTYEVDENGNLIDPNRRKFGPADPRVDPRTTKKASLSQLAKDRDIEAEVALNQSIKNNTKSYAPSGYDPSSADSSSLPSSSSTPDTSINAPTGTSSGGSGGYGGQTGLATMNHIATLADFYRNKQQLGTGDAMIRGGATGATAGAEIGSFFGPIGTGIGAAAGGVIGTAAGSGYLPHPKERFGQAREVSKKILGTDNKFVTAAALMSPLGLAFLGLPMNLAESRTRVEEEKIKQLAEKGIVVPTDPTAPKGKPWELNQAFSTSRNEGDLIGADIITAADWYAAIPEWSTLSDENKTAMAQQAINQGVIREHHGTIDIDFASNPAFTAWVEQMMRSQKDPARKIPYNEAYPMEYASAQQARKQNIASFAMSNLASEYQSPFSSGSGISLDNPYLR